MPTKHKAKGKEPHWKGVVVVQGNRREKHFPDASLKSKRAAIEWENEMREELKAELAGTLTDCCPNVLGWATQYLDYSKISHAPVTYDEKKRCFKYFLSYIHPNIPVTDITIPVLTKFMMKMFEERSGNVANRCRKNLATAWSFGKKAISGFPKGENPFLEVDRMPETRKPTYIPPEEDFWAVWDIADEQDKVLLLFALHTAARRSEIFRAKVADVDFSRDTIQLGTKKRLNGNTEYDLIPMTKTLKKAIKEWLGIRPVESEYLFVNLSEYNYASDFYGEPFVARQHFPENLCKKAGVKKFSYHCIRHLSAVIVYDEGESQSVIQNVLRHKSPTTTARYIHTLGLKGTRAGLERVMEGRGM